MPRTVAVGRQQVLSAALELLRKKGRQALSARAIAHRLGCSTQPIYSVFGNMRDLERALLREVRQFYREFLDRDRGGSTPFENIGIGYLGFAREEPRLFNWLLESGRLKVDFDAQRHAPEVQLGLDRMAADPSLAGLAPHQIERLQRNLWIFTHGLAVLLSSGMLRAKPDTARGYMNEMAETAIAMEQLRRPKG